MSYFNERTGEIVLDQEEKEVLQGRKRLDVEGLMNWIIWGNKKGTMAPKVIKERLEREVEKEIGDGLWKQKMSHNGNIPAGYDNEGNYKPHDF